ncbi:MAG: insulinase family protein [Rhizobiaceae bacterium]|nr:insulinase family protein [Rhizobiaceae bacterium]
MKSFIYALMLGVALTSQTMLPVQANSDQVKTTTQKTVTTTSVKKGPDISTFELENGLQVVVIPDNRAPVVTHMLWYKAGAADEPAGKSGIAHYLEHLMFKGTKTVPAGEFSAKVAEIGGQENAFTSSDFTGYYQKVSPDALKMAMAYEADRMENLVLSEEIIKTELKVILEERRSRIDNNPGSILAETVESTLFRHHPYGIPIIGYENEIRNLKLEDAIAYYDKYYTPNNAILIVAGDIDEKTVREYAKDTYAKVARRAEPGKRKRVVEPVPVTARTVTYEDERVTTPSMTRIYLVPSYNTAEPGVAEALDILGNILGGASTSRLHRQLVIDNEFATSISAGLRGGALDMTRFSIHASPRGDTTIVQLEEKIDKALDDIIANGVTQKELDQARNTMIKSSIYSRDNQSTMARIIGAVLAMDGELGDVLNWPELLKKVTVEQVNAVARKYLVKSRSVTGFLLPKNATDVAQKS